MMSQFGPPCPSLSGQFGPDFIPSPSEQKGQASDARPPLASARFPGTQETHFAESFFQEVRALVTLSALRWMNCGSTSTGKGSSASLNSKFVCQPPPTYTFQSSRKALEPFREHASETRCSIQKLFSSVIISPPALCQSPFS